MALYGIFEKCPWYRKDKLQRGFDHHEPLFIKKEHELGYFS